MTGKVQEIVSSQFTCCLGDLSNPSKDQISLCFKDSYMRENFSLESEIGKGGYGMVVKVRNTHDKKIYALKVIPLYEGDQEEKLKREVEVLAKVSSHDNIVGYNTSWTIKCPLSVSEITSLQSIDDSEIEATNKSNVVNLSINNLQSYESDQSSNVSKSVNSTSVSSGQTQQKFSSNESLPKVWTGKMFIIQMEFCEQTLRQFINNDNPNKDEEICRILQEIISGMKFFHGEKVIHRDLKPINIFMDTFGHVKIGDFGLAKLTEAETFYGQEQGSSNDENASSLTDGLGTYLYQAPELKTVSSSQNIHKRYDKCVDLYSLGIIIFEMCYRFKTQTERIHILSELREKLIFPDDFESIVGPVASEYKEIIHGLLCFDPKNRYRLEKVEEMLQSIIESKNVSRSNSVTMEDKVDEIPRTSTERGYLGDIVTDIGIYQWSSINRISSVCFPIAENIIITVQPKHMNKRYKADGSVKFSGHMENGQTSSYTKRRVKELWKGSEYRYCNPVILQIKPPANHVLPFRPVELGGVCLHDPKLKFFVFYRGSNSFHEIEPKRVVDHCSADTHISTELYFFEHPSSTRNVGAPIICVSEERNPVAVGLVTQNFYSDGRRLGTVFISMLGIQKNCEKRLPSTSLNNIFEPHNLQEFACVSCTKEYYERKLSTVTRKNENLEDENKRLRAKLQNM